MCRRAAGWAQSKLLEDPNCREARFGPYDSAHAEQLVADVSGRRGPQEGGGADKDRPTAFYMVYDQRGWHIFVRSGEPLKAADKLTAADVDRLFKQAVPDWMEFDCMVQELRREHLRKQLVAP